MRTINKSALATAAVALCTIGSALACEPNCQSGDSLTAMWKLTTSNATSAFGPAGTEALIGNMSNNKLRIKVGGVLDVQEQALGSVVWEGVLGKDGVPLGVDTGLATRIEGMLKVRVNGGELCLTGDCAP